MADGPMKMAKELRTYLAEDLGLTVKPHKALTEPQVTFAVMLGLMREQATESRRTPKVPCYFINRFPDQLTGTWATTPEGRLVQVLVDAGGPHMDKHKMWRLVLFTWLGAGGVHGQPWQELCAIPAIMMYSRKLQQKQPWEVMKYAMMCVQRSSNRLLSFFGSDGRDKGLRFSRDYFRMLALWHDSVPTLTAAFAQGSESFLQAMKKVRGFGELTQKEVFSYLGVSSHPSFRAMAAEAIPFGPGAKQGALVFLGAKSELLRAATRLRPHLQDCMRQHFPHVHADVSVTDIEIFLCYGLTYAKMACKLRAELAGNRFCKIPYGVACHRADSIAWTPAGWTTWAAGKERAALPHRQFALASAPPARSRKSPASLARHWRLDSLAKHFEQISAKRALSEAGVDNGGGPGSKKRPAASAELRDPTGSRSPSSNVDGGRITVQFAPGEALPPGFMAVPALGDVYLFVAAVAFAMATAGNLSVEHESVYKVL
ncbi:unnamed protein product [Symbiodinium natans]|uniref:Uncharacterized protein n=1 Tax=Symbiodinium natans TaxID=878477 RepID=A0A812M2W0_9DINO|nr:unnamed protein product [Symbiodinium natans]